MSKIRCEQKNCKYNCSTKCTKEGIYVDKHASCDSYEEGKFAHDYKHEFATFENKQTNIKCNATHCLYNKERSCIVKTLNVRKDDHSATCADYEQMN